MDLTEDKTFLEENHIEDGGGTATDQPKSDIKWNFASNTSLYFISTCCGILTCLIWSTGVSLTRVLSTQMPQVASSAAVYSLGGAFGLIFLSVRDIISNYRSRRGLPSKGISLLSKYPIICFNMKEPLNWKYTLVCGFLFVSNSVTFALAIIFAQSNETVVGAAVVNDLWPVFSVACTVLLLKFKTRGKGVVFPLGMGMSFCGVFLVSAGKDFSVFYFLRSVYSDPIPYILALLAAVSWPLYSSLCRLWAAESRNFHVSVFLLLSGMIQLILSISLGEIPEKIRPMSVIGLLELLYAGILTNYVGYELWDIGVTRGSVTVINTFANLMPLFSIVTSSLFLQVDFTPNFGIGAALVMIGAILCKWSVVEPSGPQGQSCHATPTPTGASPHIGQTADSMSVEMQRMLDDAA